MIFFLFLLITWIVGTRKKRLGEAVLTSTHKQWFGVKLRKIGLSLQTSVFSI